MTRLFPAEQIKKLGYDADSFIIEAIRRRLAGTYGSKSIERRARGGEFEEWKGKTGLLRFACL